jgi:two-component system response regulator DevR
MNSVQVPQTPPARPPIQILLVDDHLVTRMGLRTLLGGYPQVRVVGEAGSVGTALLEAQRLRPDLILLDVRLPDGNGFEACRQLERLGIEARVLILTSYGDDETVFESIAAGADGYMLKDIDPPGLIHAIETVAAGQSILDPAVTRLVLSRVRLREPELQPDARLNALSAQERRVLALVAQGKTNKEIAAEMKLSDKTVKNYLSNTLDKLKVSRRSQAAAYFVQHAADS